MSKEFWGKSAKSVEIRRNNEKVVIPAFSAQCGQAHACINYTGSIWNSQLNSVKSDGSLINFAFNGTAGFTIDFWSLFKRISVSDYIFLFSNFAGTRKFRLFYSLVSDALTYEITTSTGLQTGNICNLSSYFYSWHRFTFVFSVALGTLVFYIDKNVISSNAITGSFDNSTYLFGNDGATTFNGFISDFKLFSSPKTQAVLYVNGDAPTSSTIEPTLVFYVRGITAQAFDANNSLSPGKGTQSTFGLIVNSGTAIILDTTNYAPLKYGASFIAAKFNVAALSGTDNLSLKFPVVPPLECNFGLAISWTDPIADTFQRRLLWNPDSDLGVLDIAPALVPYNGERLPPTFDLEVWNIDGFATCDLLVAKDILLSITSTPATSIDSSNTSLGTLTKDSTLAQNFPLTPFPLVFNSAQTY